MYVDCLTKTHGTWHMWVGTRSLCREDGGNNAGEGVAAAAPGYWLLRADAGGADDGTERPGTIKGGAEAERC